MDDPLADVVIPARPCPPSRHTLDEWYEEADQLDHMHHARHSTGEHYWWLTAEPEHRRDAVVRLAAEGRSFDDIARRYEVDPEDVALAVSNPRGAASLLRVERIWRAHQDWPWRDVQRAAGLHPNNKALEHWAARIGVQNPITARKRTGGGSKHDDAWYETLRHMREDMNMSWRQIGKKLGLDYSTPYRLYQRRYGVKADA